MPGLHVYCVTPPDRMPPAGLCGVDDADVHAVVGAGIACWASRHERRPLADVAGARAHNAVVEAAMDTEVTPVPVRFGQWFVSEQAAITTLGAQVERWTALLARFAGRCEWGVRVIGGERAREMHPAPAETGTAYMRRLARTRQQEDERSRAADRVAADVAARIGSLAHETRVEHVPGADIMNLSHLVAWSDATAYHTVLRKARDEHRPLRFLFTGPWPPYSFVE